MASPVTLRSTPAAPAQKAAQSDGEAAWAEAVAARWLAAMRRGDFPAAWRETDRLERSRRRVERRGGRAWKDYHLLWNGQAFAQREVIVRCNHGLGDTLQFIRFVPRIRALAKAVIVLAQPPLVELLRRNGRFGEVRDGWADPALPPDGLEIEIMELAYALRISARDLEECPYLPCEESRATPELIFLRKPVRRLRVGLLWAASGWDPGRSIPLAKLAPLHQFPEIEFFSLQQGPEAEEWSSAPFPLVPLARHTRGVLAAAQAMQALDLIISVDGMAAHLAAALGRPTWLLLQHQADWRWGEATRRTPWYPSMRLFRQPAPGDWEAVADKVAKSLADKPIWGRP